MSKKETTNKTNEQTDKRAWYGKLWDFVKSSTFAWLIIWTMAVLLCGLVTGWTLRSDDNAFSNAQIQKTIESVTQSLK